MAEFEPNDIGQQLNQMSDENLLQKAIKEQNNNALDCLINRYKDMVNIKANKFFMVGLEKKDTLGYTKLLNHITVK